MAIYITQK